MREISEKPATALWGRLDIISDIAAVALAILAVYTAGFGVFDNILLSGTTVALGMAVVLLQTDVKNSRYYSFFTLGILVLFFWLTWVWFDIMLAQEEFFINISEFQLALGWVAIALIGFVTWHLFGLPLLVVYIALAIYILAPGSMFGAGEEWARVSENLWYSTDGVFGRPVEVVGRVVLIFIVFGAVLQTSGAGAVLLQIAFSATRRFTGGPAHASIVGSAIFGTISGSAVANVVSTGVFTIPIIKKAGFKPKFAGAVEAAASAGGQIMPPVMGVVAFLMADITGIPYLKIIVAATIPAILYYASLFTIVLIEARRLNLQPANIAKSEGMTRSMWVQILPFFIPLILIIWLLASGHTAQHAGFYALIAASLLCLVFFPRFRNPKRWWDALVHAGRTAATLMVIVAAIGFIIGVMNMSGVGLRFAQAILVLSDSSLFLSLILVMFGCLVMGLGVPSAPAYLIAAIVMGPALGQLGVPIIAAHLFMLYFAVLSVVTPPVALAAFAAAPLAGAKPMETGFEALRLAVAGFIIPFIFVFHPDILIIDGFTVAGLGWAILAFALATWLIATGLSRFDVSVLPLWQAGLRIIAAILVLFPDMTLAATGTILGIGLIGLHRFKQPSLENSKISNLGE